MRAAQEEATILMQGECSRPASVDSSPATQTEDEHKRGIEEVRALLKARGLALEDLRKE